MSVLWKQAPPSPTDETALVLETLQGLDVVIPATVLAVLAGLLLLRRALRPRRKRRRLDAVLPYAHAEPE